VQETSELTFWILLADGNPPYADVNTALVGSGTWLDLPAGSTDDGPVRLFIRRSPLSSSWQFGLVSASFSVLNVDRVDFYVYGLQGNVWAHTVVR